MTWTRPAVDLFLSDDALDTSKVVQVGVRIDHGNNGPVYHGEQ